MRGRTRRRIRGSTAAAAAAAVVVVAATAAVVVVAAAAVVVVVAVAPAATPTVKAVPVPTVMTVEMPRENLSLTEYMCREKRKEFLVVTRNPTVQVPPLRSLPKRTLPTAQMI